MKNIYTKMGLVLGILMFLILIFLMEFQAYQKFYSGEHNIDLGYNMKNSTFKYDMMSDGTIIKDTELYRLGSNQMREGLVLFTKSKLIVLSFGFLLGFLANNWFLSIYNISNKSKEVKKVK